MVWVERREGGRKYLSQRVRRPTVNRQPLQYHWGLGVGRLLRALTPSVEPSERLQTEPHDGDEDSGASCGQLSKQ